MSKQPLPAPTVSTAGPCPTIIQISRTPRHWKLIQNHCTTRPPPDLSWQWYYFILIFLWFVWFCLSPTVCWFRWSTNLRPSICHIFQVQSTLDISNIDISKHPPIFMPPTSKKLRGHIGLGLSVCPSDRLSVCPSDRLSVCPSVRLSVTPYVGCKTREPLKLGTWNFIYSISTKNKRIRIFFFFGRPLYGKVMPLFRLSHKNLVNTIT